MHVDRATRSLIGLGSASSSRVLNLAAISVAEMDKPAYHAAPFFLSPVLNESIILKHRLRNDEIDFFKKMRSVATKIIIPFEKTDLRVGGQSFFVGQRGFDGLLAGVGNYGSNDALHRDADVLRLIDELPSLDPFLLREHLRSNGITPAECYFAISDADQERMFQYAANEVRRLMVLAVGGADGAQIVPTNRMVSALLSSEVNDRLDPLRATLNLDPSEFNEGIFSWRGFLYYKWSLEEFWPSLITVLKELKAIKPAGKTTSEETVQIEDAKRAIIHGVKKHNEDVRRIIGVYDKAYANLIDKRDPKMFRAFLLDAPSLFLDMGEKLGAMSHVTSFWQYRFPPHARRTVQADELLTILWDFSQSFGAEMSVAA
jgi:hypothetical protein